MKNVAIYVRVSTNDGKQTVENQIEPLKAYCENRKLPIWHIYVDEGISGAESSRPGLNKLMDDANRGQFDMVLVWKFDRLARSVKHLLATLDEFRALGIDFISLTEAVDTSTPMGKMIFTVLAAVAELERSLIQERTAAGVARAAKAGRFSGRPNKVVDKERIVQLRSEGSSVRTIAGQLKVSKSTISNLLHKTPLTRA